ncbi:MAG: NIL domain-containing protein [Candidatus Alcyoniella australis]|nr:NIL domain-containing protein [Candidatus Alcyoniella australis]
MEIHKIKVLKVNKANLQRPVVCELSRKFDLTFSILKAKILPRQVGLIILEFWGEQHKYEEAMEFLTSQGVRVEGIEQEIAYDEHKCTQCGACVTFCPSAALRIDDRKTMKIVYHPEDCVGCELCLTGCGPRAMSVANNYVEFAVNA